MSVARGIAMERRAEAYLCAAGLQFVARNFRCRGGEIDLILRDRESLVFAEVRSRTLASPCSAIETITQHKQRRISKAARFYLHRVGDPDVPCRFDVICFDGPEDNLSVTWIKDAFHEHA